ncbi:MAG: AAA family ATPase, partial [Ectothiorhodospiraceae bacterium]|nr:AAA family ATPase [Ectothiorhodospiraceae bacterium]
APRQPEPPKRETPPPPPLGPRGTLQIDFRRLRDNGVYPPDAMQPGLKDQYRRIKRPLLANATGRKGIAVERGNLIMVTSAISGEGKTFTSLNLAMSIAQDPDYSVTLVDGDVARASASKLLGVQDSLGLLDLLADETVSAQEVVLQTSVPSLSILPAGRPHSLSEELLSSERMERVVAALADRNTKHIILFDSPPLLASPDAVTLSANVGQVVVVVKAGSTLRHQVVEAVDLLDGSKAINMVLNQSIGGMGGDEYGDYYGAYAEGR